MIDERDIKFPELLILWQNRDLVDHAPAFGDYRAEFYKGSGGGMSSGFGGL